MSKILLLLLFALVQSIKINGREVYEIDKLRIIYGGVVQLKVKEGDEFYLKCYENGSIPNRPGWWPTNTNEIPDALEAKGSEYYEIGEGKLTHLGLGGYKKYLYKALKPSFIEIALKFTGRSRFSPQDLSLVVKIDILPKDKTS